MEEEGEQKEAGRRAKHEPSTRARSVENVQACWDNPGVDHETECLEKAGRSLGPGFECQFKDLGASELPKDFRTGNDMIRCET